MIGGDCTSTCPSAWRCSQPHRLAPALRLILSQGLMLRVGRAGAVAGPSRDSASTAKLEVGGVEGAGVSPFFTAGACPVDQFAGKFRRRHPDRRLESWIFLGEFRLEPRLTYSHDQS